MGPDEEKYSDENQNKRAALRIEYEKSLPEDKQLALWLHDTTCHKSHAKSNLMCHFNEERYGLEDDWNDWTHKDYLNRVKKLREVTDDIELIKKIIKAAHG